MKGDTEFYRNFLIPTKYVYYDTAFANWPSWLGL